MPGKARRCSICIAALLVGVATAAFAGGDESVPGRGQGTAPVLTGRVVDTEGRPIPGIKIWSVDEEPLAITGTDGTFVLHGLPPVPLLAVCPPGWVHQQIQPLLLHSRSIELRLQPATRISGRVVDNSGEPAAGVTARGEPIDLELRLGLPGTIRVRLTGLPPGERGYVDLKDRPNGDISGSEKDLHSFDNIPPGEWTLVASDSNGRTFERFVEVGEGETVTVDDIDFPPLPSIRGRVLDPAGRPSEQAIVTFMQGELEISAEADSAGSFLAWLREGAWTIRAEHEGSGPAIATVELSGDAPVELPDLRLVRLVAVSGRVVGADPEVVIPWVRAESEDGLTSSGSAVEQDNRFSLPDLWPGTWTLSTDIDGRPVSTTLQIPPGATEVRIDWEVRRSAAG